MSDGPFVIGANGLIVDVSANGYGPGYASVGQQPNIATGESPNSGDTPSPGPWVVTKLLPGALIQLRGGGEYDLLSTARSPMLAIGTGTNPQIGGTMGSMQVDLVTGTAGTIQGLAFLVNAVPPTAYLGIYLDAQNRPACTATDYNGTVKVIGGGTGSAIASGTPLSVRFFWDSTGLVIPGYAVLLVNNTVQPIGTATGPWTSFQPASVLYGRGAVFNTFLAPAATLNKVQAGNSATPTTSPIQPAVSQTPP